MNKIDSLPKDGNQNRFVWIWNTVEDSWHRVMLYAAHAHYKSSTLSKRYTHWLKDSEIPRPSICSSLCHSNEPCLISEDGACQRKSQKLGGEPRE